MTGQGTGDRQQVVRAEARFASGVLSYSTVHVDAAVTDPEDWLRDYDPEEIRQLLVSQVVSVVRWEDSVRGMIAGGCEAFYEIGPGRVLAGLLKRIDRKLKCENTAT